MPERWALLCLMKLEGCVDTYKLGLFRYWDDSVSALLLLSCIVCRFMYDGSEYARKSQS